VSFSLIESGGASYGQLILRDITERKQELETLQRSLDEREILLRELHHRVKNNLQFIQSLISLQLDYEGEEAQTALLKTKARVAALSAAYLTIADNPENLLLDLPLYLNEICSFEKTEAIQSGTILDIALSCDDIHINLDSAVLLGLMLRELVENSRIHGYDRDAFGRVEVRFIRNGETAVLSVQDFGCGLPDPRREGLGLRIVDALSKQLSGSLTLRNEPPGTHAVIQFPMS